MFLLFCFCGKFSKEGAGQQGMDFSSAVCDHYGDKAHELFLRFQIFKWLIVSHIRYYIVGSLVDINVHK